jgi:hypothetical protein
MTRHDNLDVHFLGAGNSGVEIVDLKPQEHAISVWLKVGIPDVAMMVLHVPSVQLQDQPTVRNQPFILGTAMCALTTKQTLIPATARFDITHANEWLWVHTNSIFFEENTNIQASGDG